jgi:hypothetical protein
MSRTILAAALALLAVTAPVQAAIVDAVFDGTIYNSFGAGGLGAVDIPISGTFQYDTMSYAYSPASTSYMSIFAPTSSNAMSITETSTLGTYAFTYSRNQALATEKFQINFGASQSASLPENYTSIDVIFPDDVFALGNVPESFSAILPPYQGSSETYVNGGAYDFYVSEVDASPVPLPPALPLFATGLLGLGAIRCRRGRKISVART